MGSALGVGALAAGVIHTATAKHLEVSVVVHRGGAMILFQMAAFAVMLVFFAVARNRRPPPVTWPVATIATLALALRQVVTLKWTAIVNPLHVAAAGLLVITGVTTAVRHLKYLSALWTTPYGYTFIAKLCAVAVVVVLGAWNWKRVKPRLGDEGAAVAIRRSAIRELAVAGVVLLITAMLVSLPSPRLPSAQRPIAPGSIGAPR